MPESWYAKLIGTTIGASSVEIPIRAIALRLAATARRRRHSPRGSTSEPRWSIHIFSILLGDRTVVKGRSSSIHGDEADHERQATFIPGIGRQRHVHIVESPLKRLTTEIHR